MDAKSTRFFPARVFKDICYSSACGCGLSSCEYLMNSTPLPLCPLSAGVAAAPPWQRGGGRWREAQGGIVAGRPH